MTFARVMVWQGMDEHGPLYARPAGVSTETFRGSLRIAWKIAALTVFARGGYDARNAL